MKSCCIFFVLFFILQQAASQQCRFETSGGKETATYFEAIDWYKKLDAVSPNILLKQMDETDAGYPLHLVLVSADGKFSPAQWHQQQKVVVLVNNGIHPGEPDGIDASMMLVRDIVTKKIKLPGNVVLAFIPVYNIGGCLNRGTSSRVNQNGPAEYGFRGNAQNLDLNRDFTKCDSKEAGAFTKIFHWLQPDIFIDNHVSDGADYQHTFTLLTTQYDKLGPVLGKWLKQEFEPALYKGMAEKKWDVCPYVNFETASPDNGMEMFYDPPRYSSGYAALFQTIAFVPETHMLKPFKDRVNATYAFMQTVMEQAGVYASALVQQRAAAKLAVARQQEFPLSWTVDSSQSSVIGFKGYEAGHKKSEVTGLDRLYYDHDKPFVKQVPYYNVFRPLQLVKKPTAYMIPQGWGAVIRLLKLNGVQLKALVKDTVMEVEAYHIDEYKSYNKPYEKHHKNYAVKVSVARQQVRFLKGDQLIYLDQPAGRYIVEMLEPQGEDGFFAWNFFDAVLQQKEGYSDYRWEDIAAEVLKRNPALQEALNTRRNADSTFAADATAQLEFVYRHSNYYEPMHLRYPVFRLIQ